MVLLSTVFQSRVFSIYFILCFQLFNLPGSWSLQLLQPSSASQYAEVVSGQRITVRWEVEDGDPSTFKMKLRNRSIRNGVWTLQESVATSLGRLDVVLPDLTPEVHYYVEAVIYTPDLKQIATTNDFAVIDANDAHLSSTPTPSPSSSPSQTTQSTLPPQTITVTNQPTPSSTSTPSTSKSSDPSPATTLVLKTGYSTLIQTITGPSNSLSSGGVSTSPATSPSAPLSSQTPSSTAETGSTTNRKTNLGAILGGVFGGVIALVAVALCLILSRRRQAMRTLEEEHVVPFVRAEKKSSNAMPRELDDKDRLRQLLQERETLEQRRDSLQTNLAQRSSTAISNAEATEAALRRQIEEMNYRIIQLEAMRGTTEPYSAQLMDNIPPPQYTSRRDLGV